MRRKIGLLLPALLLFFLFLDLLPVYNGSISYAIIRSLMIAYTGNQFLAVHLFLIVFSLYNFFKQKRVGAFLAKLMSIYVAANIYLIFVHGLTVIVLGIDDPSSFSFITVIGAVSIPLIFRDIGFSYRETSTIVFTILISSMLATLAIIPK